MKPTSPVACAVALFTVAIGLAGCPNPPSVVEGWVYTGLGEGWAISERGDGTLFLTTAPYVTGNLSSVSISFYGEEQWRYTTNDIHAVGLTAPKPWGDVTPNGDGILAGRDTSSGQGVLRVARLNANGQLLWDFSYPEVGDVNAVRGVAALSDGSCVVGGNYYDEEFRPFLIRLDAIGAVLWALDFGAEKHSGVEFLTAISATYGSDIFLVGARGANPTFTHVSKVSLAGEVVWSRDIADSSTGATRSIAAAPDGGAVIVAYANQRPVLRRIDADGELLWSRGDLIGPEASYDSYQPYDVAVAANGDIAVVGRGDTIRYILIFPNYEAEGFVALTDPNGERKWLQTFPRLGTNLWAVTALQDGGFATAGGIATAETVEGDDKSAHVMIFDPDGAILN